MSLSAREEQILGSIEDGLARSDHKLAWMLAAFTRLASGEELPAREKVRAAGLVADLRGRRHRRRNVARRNVARRLCQLLGLAQYRGLWLAAAAAAAVAAVALVTVALAVSHGGSGSGRGSCPAPRSAACAAQAPAHPPGSGVHKAASGQSPHAG
ncbi:MAG: hypothetical protein ACRDOU_02370 [Streptosporangiaceae bacterium]